MVLGRFRTPVDRLRSHHLQGKGSLTETKDNDQSPPTATKTLHVQSVRPTETSKAINNALAGLADTSKIYKDGAHNDGKTKMSKDEGADQRVSAGHTSPIPASPLLTSQFSSPQSGIVSPHRTGQESSPSKFEAVSTPLSCIPDSDPSSPQSPPASLQEKAHKMVGARQLSFHSAGKGKGEQKSEIDKGREAQKIANADNKADFTYRTECLSRLGKPSVQMEDLAGHGSPGSAGLVTPKKGRGRPPKNQNIVCPKPFKATVDVDCGDFPHVTSARRNSYSSNSTTQQQGDGVTPTFTFDRSFASILTSNIHHRPMKLPALNLRAITTSRASESLSKGQKGQKLDSDLLPMSDGDDEEEESIEEKALVCVPKKRGRPPKKLRGKPSVIDKLLQRRNAEKQRKCENLKLRTQAAKLGLVVSPRLGQKADMDSRMRAVTSAIVKGKRGRPRKAFGGLPFMRKRGRPCINHDLTTGWKYGKKKEQQVVDETEDEEQDAQGSIHGKKSAAGNGNTEPKRKVGRPPKKKRAMMLGKTAWAKYASSIAHANKSSSHSNEIKKGDLHQGGSDVNFQIKKRGRPPLKKAADVTLNGNVGVEDDDVQSVGVEGKQLYVRSDKDELYRVSLGIPNVVARKRGRPPLKKVADVASKEGVQEEGDDVEQADDDESAQGGASNANDSNSNIICVPRKRGRPPLKKAVDVALEGNAGEEDEGVEGVEPEAEKLCVQEGKDEPAQASHTDGNMATVPRKRGRPPLKKAPELAQKESMGDEGDDVESLDVEAEKHISQADNDEPAQDGASNGNTVLVPRKRGRPLKKVVQVKSGEACNEGGDGDAAVGFEARQNGSTPKIMQGAILQQGDAQHLGRPELGRQDVGNIHHEDFLVTREAHKQGGSPNKAMVSFASESHSIKEGEEACSLSEARKRGRPSYAPSPSAGKNVNARHPSSLNESEVVQNMQDNMLLDEVEQAVWDRGEACLQEPGTASCGDFMTQSVSNATLTKLGPGGSLHKLIFFDEHAMVATTHVEFSKGTHHVFAASEDEHHEMVLHRGSVSCEFSAMQGVEGVHAWHDELPISVRMVKEGDYIRLQRGMCCRITNMGSESANLTCFSTVISPDRRPATIHP